jgi:hypothetical protein
MIIAREKPIVKNVLHYLGVALTLLTLAACGGGGGGGTTVTPSYSVSFASGGNGTLSGVVSQTVSQGANASSVTAVPASGYHFVNWTEAGILVSVDPALAASNVRGDHSYLANFAINTAVSFKIVLTGALPAATAVAGATFTLGLPAGVTPALTNGAVAADVVALSGTFAGGTIAPVVAYTAATPSATGSLQVILVSSVPAGVTQVGEVATITLQIPTGTVWTESSFGLSAVRVRDAALADTIAGMGVAVSNLKLQ